MANILTQSLERMSPSFSILRNALITPGKSWPTRLQPLKAGRKGLAELRIHRRKETVPQVGAYSSFLWEVFSSQRAGIESYIKTPLYGTYSLLAQLWLSQLQVALSNIAFNHFKLFLFFYHFHILLSLGYFKLKNLFDAVIDKYIWNR